MKGFDEWYFKQNHLGIEPIDHARESYKAGAASRQAEIDELRKKLERLQSWLNFEDIRYSLVCDIVDHANEILEGESND